MFDKEDANAGKSSIDPWKTDDRPDRLNLFFCRLFFDRVKICVTDENYSERKKQKQRSRKSSEI